MWHIVQNSDIQFDEAFKSISVLPYSFTYIIRKRMQIDSWMELPNEKRPPESIWDDPKELEEWFDRVFDRDAQTEFNIPVNDEELER